MANKPTTGRSRSKPPASTNDVTKAPTPPAAAASLEVRLADAIAELAATEAAVASSEKRLKRLEAKQLARIKKNIAATEKRLNAKSPIVREGWRPEGPVDYVVAPLPEPDGPLPFPVELRCFARALPSKWDRPKPNAIQRFRYTANGRFPVEPEIVEVIPPPILGFPADEQSPVEPTPRPRRSADKRRSDASLELEALIAQWATLRPIVSTKMAALVDDALKSTKGLLGRQVPDDRLRSTVDDLIDVAEQLDFELDDLRAARSEPVDDGAADPDVEKTARMANASEPASGDTELFGSLGSKGDGLGGDHHVTLQQMAGIVSKEKRTLERLKSDGKLPPPDVTGKLGAANEWKWATVRPILETEYGRTLPERFPSDPFNRS